MKILLTTLSLWVLLIISVSTQAKDRSKPKLVLQITVDQFRGDLPQRYKDRLGKAGLRYLLEKGTHYSNAHYTHANTETAVGHATLFTGADPSRHGLVGNYWMDLASGELVYNTEDSRHHLIGKDPKPHQGTSPRNLLSSTIGDELVLASAGKSRVFSVSVKDRGAIIPGGHAGKAFWYSKRSGQFVTSTYYYDQYPKWVEQWNQKKYADQYKGKAWELLHEPSTYLSALMDDRPFEANLKPFGRTFPHPYGEDNKYLYLLLSLSPAGDELTLNFTKALIENEQLGKSDATDFLAVSFSSTDYIGHLFGPSSLESEDNVLRLDRSLEDLFQYIDKKIGLQNTLIILSADHGAPEAPEYMAELGMETGRFDFTYFRKKGPLNVALIKKYGRDDLIATHSHPYLYLNLKAIAEAELDVEEVERFVAAEAMKIPGIAYAQTRSQLQKGQVTHSPLQRQIERNFHPKRSGHIYLVQEQYWFLHSTDEASKMGLKGIAAIHGSPWAYDTYVPIFFAGHGIAAQTITRAVSPADIAPTVANYLNIKFPSASNGIPLVEVFFER
ncbi:alkaline phosphatase family protein [bacterium AH-315-K03]|nr:alkaline phosphatase family protein [bacterium AH-315-K03]